jgi:hypothetical protein
MRGKDSAFLNSLYYRQTKEPFPTASDQREMQMKRLAQHLGGTIWLYFSSIAVSYAFFWWAMVAAMTSRASGENFGTYGALFLVACLLLFLVIVSWGFAFVAVFRELYGVLFPEELWRGPPVRIRGMRPGHAVGALRTISWLDRFRRVFPQAALPLSLVALGELVILFYFPAPPIPLLPLFFAFPFCLFALWVPSGLSRFVSPSQRLLSILSILHFLRSRQEDLTTQYARSIFLFDVRQIVRTDERFVIRKASSYLNDFLAEVAPAAIADLKKFWATLYVAMSLKAEDDDEFQKAANTIEAMRQILVSSGHDRVKVNQLLGALTSVKDSLRDSWRIVEENNVTVETETPPSRQQLQTFLSVLSLVATFVLGLLRLLLR